MQKKKVLIHSNHCKMFTGFGKHKKNLLSYLYKTGKYELFELSNSLTWSSDSTKLTPWKCVGSLPDDQELIREIQKDPKRSQMLAYGSETIDKAINEFKPDIYLGIEDIWGFNGYYDKPWWNKVNCIIHTTLDSVPILPDAVDAASKIKHYFVWASFAEKALHDLGYKHVKTVRGSLDVDDFHKLPLDQTKKLRKLFNIEDNFIIGFVFRNQLRKSVPNLLDGFKLFCDKLTKEQSDKCVLVMHTTPIDNNGTDLYAVRDKICPNYDVVFSTNKIESDVLNKLYNVADCTINIANNEGFGLGTAESIMAGTPIIVSVTGGLQDQCGFNYTADDYINIKTLHNKQIHKDTPHGVWAKPIWPSAININGSPLTPYIYDDRVNDEEVADAINEMYLLGKEKRKENGQVGREWAINNLSSKVMCDAMSEGIQKTIKNFTPRERFNLYKVI